MIWLALIALAATALAPLGVTLWREARPRGRRDASLAWHRAQRIELDRERVEGRLLAAEHAMAVLEIERRLLTVGGGSEEAASRSDRGPIVLTMILVPLAACGLYLVGGMPGLPAAPLAPRLTQAEARAREDQRLIDGLRQHLSQLDPATPQARQGYVLLGRVEAARGNMKAAAVAWTTALATGFDATLALEAAEAETEAAGHVTAASAELFRRARDAAPPDAPWRPMVDRRLAEWDRQTPAIPARPHP